MTPRKGRLVSVANQLPAIVGLVVLWMLLWGSFSWLNFVTGTGVAVLVSVSFYLVPVQLSNRVNPWFVLTYLVRLIIDIVRASVQVAGLALSPRLVTSNAILAVHLRTRSDLILTWTAVSTSIVPGSIVVDIDREHSTLYLHVLNVHSAAGIERFRRTVLETERRIIRAVGSRQDLERLRGVTPPTPDDSTTTKGQTP
ncbi:Na+/H+ antiporter subunit E [Cryobacterium psychrophilum]|uniref:Na+/H+ antiporter subunit E n=1 Tax=Cryobacterium psychrophilum TaxID=41988 RepID=A0A4Y8KR07_9MICO|nr:Na+/H+ antiporter subunit E [Cryobacterium psychrophilum]TDW29573.1 multisubunit sodium/proton antiporter MrpE subunit [Cryobacterium psychrophilum]TFD81705.1 Na+/H+ antiporter subunit E [Cryobacterium psychrophilum]